MTHGDHLKRLENLRTQVDAHSAALKKLRSERDELILEAFRYGIRVNVLAQAGGVTRARVYQLANGAAD